MFHERCNVQFARFTCVLLSGLNVDQLSKMACDSNLEFATPPKVSAARRKGDRKIKRTIRHGIGLLQHSVRTLRLRVEPGVGHAGEGGRVLVGLHGGVRGVVTAAAAAAVPAARRCVVRAGTRAAAAAADRHSFRAALTSAVWGVEAASPAAVSARALLLLLLLLRLLLTPTTAA